MTDVRFDVPFYVREAQTRLIAVTDDLRLLKLLNDKEHGQVEELLDRADRAEALGLSAARRTEDERADIANKVASGELEVDAIHSEAAKLPEKLHVVRIAETVYTACVHSAERIAYAHTAEAPAILNEHFATLAAEAADIAAKLNGVTSAEQAIERNVTDEWLAVADLISTNITLRAISDRLREAGRLVRPDGDGGPWWRFRTPAKLDRGGYRRTPVGVDPDGGRAAFLAEMAAGPYVPASREEAMAAMAVHDAATIAYQTGGVSA
ncbi:MAG: hypothetical protein WAW17_27960 [Rhodococcus sp. (in: high G+C Gram-positive bacteria)]|uniref:hypothetical protein n=1 Tax=Rhodococcus sp. TaxID=1831 RepID=UPI003BB15F5D